jgi:hypothetical protein
MLAELNESLGETEDLIGVIPGLKAVTDRYGKVGYTYGGVAMESLSKEDLTKLLSRVRQALVKIRTDRIQKQLEIIKRTEKIQSAADMKQPPRLPAAPPSLPKAPPSIPSTLRRR